MDEETHRGMNAELGYVVPCHSHLERLRQTVASDLVREYLCRRLH